MANYVEQAVLKVVDQSSDSIRTVNKELSKLFATARKGAKIKIKMDGIEVIGRAAKKATTDLVSLESKGKAALSSLSRAAARTGADLSKVGTKSVAKGFNTNSAIAELRRLKVAADKLSSMSKISIPVNLPGLRGAVTQARALNHELDRMARRTVTPTVNYRQNGKGPASSIPTVRVETSAFDQMLRGAAMFMGAQIENAIISGLVKGTTDIDVARTRLALQQLEKTNPELAAVIPQLAADEAARDNTTSIGGNAGLIAELVPVLGANASPDVVKAVLEELNRSIQLQVALGKDRITAESEAILLLKSAEQSGSITDENGKVDLVKVDGFFDLVNKTAIQLGQEFSATLINQMLKYLRGTKFTIDDRGFLTTAFLTEELGTTAAVGLNQATKQLAGKGLTKASLAEQERLGIAKPGEYVLSGVDGNGEETYERVGGGSVNEDLLRTDPLKFVQDVVIPALQKDDVDTNDPTEVISAVSKIVSDRTAVDALASLIIRNKELSRQVDSALAVDVSDAQLDRVNNESLLVAAAAAENQLVSVMGQLLSSVEGALIPALEGIATVAGGLAEFIAGPDGNGSAVNAGAVVGGGAVAVGGLVFGLSKLFGITALAGSGPALLTAAAALEGAAISLAAGGGGVGNLGKVGAAAATTGGAAAGGGLLSGALASILSSPAVITAALAGVVGAAFSMVDREAFNKDKNVDISNGMSDVAPFTNLPEYVPPPVPSPAAIKAAEDAIDARLALLASGANELGSTGGTSLLTGVTVTRPEYTFGDTPVGGLNSAIELKSTFDNSTAALKETFETGATSVGSAMDFGAEAFGPVAGQGFLAYAPQIGAAIGAAAAAAIGPLRTQSAALPVPQLVDTGRSNGF